MKLDLTLYGPVETEIRVGTTLCSLHSGENVCGFVQSHSGTQAVSEDIETAFRERERGQMQRSWDSLECLDSQREEKLSPGQRLSVKPKILLDDDIDRIFESSLPCSVQLTKVLAEKMASRIERS